ncbi:peptidylprolyl isomerase [Lachnospiraceae bacterium MD1]|uniref:Peptidylprolyl isomerase n=1 Tax=Variimorphobacter saccharofermentans TaxID=2755051 RepID=A0A839JUP5_9FIRM|nr:peptidylprolyl isomerase [Variimorphobacter saccharofermentans]MBB2181405.1 peptidylprolyl isomerase [Variimorphobacter saccharofermentans]
MKLRKLGVLVMGLLVLSVLTSCRASKDQYELTNHMGKSIATFEKRSKAELELQSNGVYTMKDVVQVMAPDNEVTSVTLLKDAGDYTVFGVGIGMDKAEAEKKLQEVFGKEIGKTINSDKNATTFSYLKDGKELYASFDINTEKVVEIAYYNMGKTKEDEEAEITANNGELIAMIGDTRVYYNEAMVYLKSAQENYEVDYGKNIWGVDILGDGKTFGELIKDEVINQITELKIIRAKAKELGITLTEEEIAEANSYAKEHFEGLAEKDISRYLITEELLQQIYADNLLAEKVFETLTINVDTNVPDIEANQITVQHILIYNGNYNSEGNKVEYSEEEREEAYEKVKSLLTQAKETEDFKALAEANSEADTIEYTFGRGQGPKEYSPSFEQAAFTLKTGQVSDIITTDYGWHILYCVSDFNEDATIQVKESIIEERRNKMFAELYSKWTADYDIVINSEAWKAVTYE